MTEDQPEKMPPVPPFVRFVASAIPMTFDDSLSYYEALCALWKYVQGMTDVINNNATLEEEYILKFNELKSFVDNYFANLDVQEEINNKLDQMAEDGTLAAIISQYLNSTALFGYDTVADMKSATNLIDGSYARTLGFHAKNDGGAAVYKIREITNDDVVDEATIIEMGDGSDELVAELIVDSPVNIKTLGAYGDGTHDDYEKIQNGIDKFHHRTIYFPEGEYLITEPIEIGTTNAEQVDLKLDSGATIKSNTAIDSLLEIGKYEGNWSRYDEGAVVTIDGGNFDATNCQRAIYISSNRKNTVLKNLNIYNASTYGIYVVKGTNTSDSSDLNIDNVVVNGTGSEGSSTGIYMAAYDNKLRNIRVNACTIAIHDHSGNFYENVHCLGSWSTGTLNQTNYEKTIAFKFDGGGVSKLNECYIDTFGTGFEFNSAMKIYLTECQSYHYLTDLTYETVLFKYKETSSNLRLFVENFDYTPPSITGTGKNYGLDIRNANSNFKQYLTVYDVFHFNQIQVNERTRVDADDYIYCQNLYPVNHVKLHDAWTMTMQAGKYYPIAILKGKSIYDVKIEMGADQSIQAKFVNESDPHLSVTNIMSLSHANQYSLAICNFVNNSGLRQSYLCVKTTASDCSYNPTISNFQGWNCQLFARRDFGNTPLDSPTVVAEASFNPQA